MTPSLDEVAVRDQVRIMRKTVHSLYRICNDFELAGMSGAASYYRGLALSMDANADRHEQRGATQKDSA